MDMSVIAGANLQTTGTRSPQRRASTDFAAALATAQTTPTPLPGVSSGLRLTKLILPTRDNVQQLASGLAQTISSRFSAAGVPAVPAVTFSVDSTGGIQVSGNRADLAAIKSLVASDSELQRSIRATNAIASHAYEIENGGHLEFQRAYRLSSDPQEIVAQYANQVGGGRPASSTSVTFAGGSVGVVADGQTWVTG